MPAKRADPITNLAAALPLRDLAAAVVAVDPQLRTRLTRIFNMAIDDVERVFRFGDARDRALYARQLVPMMLRGMQDADVGAVDTAKLEAWERIKEALGGGGE